MPTETDVKTRKISQRAGMLLIFTSIVAALYIAQDVFIPLALATLLTFVLSPVASWLERRFIPRAVAAVVVVGVVCSLTLSLSYVVGDQVVQFAHDLPKYKTEIVRKIGTLQGTGSGLTGKLFETIGEIKKETSERDAAEARAATQAATHPGAPTTAVAVDQALATIDHAARNEPPAAAGTAPPGVTADNPIYTSSVDNSPLGRVIGYVGIVIGPLGTIGLVLVLVLFMLLEREDLRDRFIRLSSGGRYIITTHALTDATTRISRFLRAQIIVNGSYGVAVALGLYIIGLTFGHGVTFPNFILFGVLCGVLRFIPYVGPWVASIFPLAVSLAVFQGFGVFVSVGMMFIAIELVSNNFMEPILYGSSTGISTVALLIAAMIWTLLWGPYGLLLSTPLTVCLVVLGRHVPSLAFLDVMLGDRPALSAGDRFYQRLIAGDATDASAVATEYAHEHGTIAAADEVFMQAIRQARHDRRVDDLDAEQESTFYRITEEVVQGAYAGDQPAAETSTEIAGRPLVIGVPAHHRAEAVAVALVTGLLKGTGVRTDAVSSSLLPADVEMRIEQDRPAAIFIAVVPPGGTSQARYLCRRLRRKFKDVPIVLGYFGTFRNFDALLIRFRASGATHVTTSIAQSRTQLATLLNLTSNEAVTRTQSGPLLADRKPAVTNATQGIDATDARPSNAAAHHPLPTAEVS